MKHIKLKESDLKNIIKQCVNEALDYDKEKKQYFPKYTGNTHSDAGKYAANDPDKYDYSRNAYKWSNPDAQDKFTSFQYKNGTEVDTLSNDEDNEYAAYEYLQQQKAYSKVREASEALREPFIKYLSNFVEQAQKQYPVLKDEYYLGAFWRDIMDDISAYDLV